jgi:hypothetical protein
LLCYSVVVVYRGGGGSEKKEGEEGAEGVEGGAKERSEATENINLVKDTPNNLVFKKISCNFGWE